MNNDIKRNDQQRFEAWARSEGLIQESHGIMSVNSMCDIARKAWHAALASQPAPDASPQLNAHDRSDSVRPLAAEGDNVMLCDLEGIASVCAKRIGSTSPFWGLVKNWANSAPGLPAIEAGKRLVEWVEQTFAAQPAPAQGEALSDAVGKFIKAKGRYHTEQNYKALVLAHDEYLAAHQQAEGGKPTANTERAWYKQWLSTLDDDLSVAQIEFGRRVWAERARRAAAGAAR